MLPTVRRVLRVLRRTISGRQPAQEDGLAVSDLPDLLGTPSPVILEIGCNDGTHTQQFLQAFPRGRVHAFEPDARARRRFAAHVVGDRVTLHPVAIGAMDGEATFFASGGAPSAEAAARLPEGWDLSGSIRAPKRHLQVNPWCRFDARSRVQVRRLDSWADEHGIETVDFIWADVQGAEVDLVRGGTRTLARTRFFYTEYSNEEMYEGQVDLRTLLGLLPDFAILRQYSGDVLLRNRRLTGAD